MIEIIVGTLAAWAGAASGLAGWYWARLRRVRRQLGAMVSPQVPAKRLNSNHLPHVTG